MSVEKGYIYIGVSGLLTQILEIKNVKRKNIISNAYSSSTCVHMSRSSEAVPSCRI